jgi:hypothetical protein
MFTLLLVAANAQTFSIQDDAVLVADPVRFPNGVGAPSVVWRPTAGRYTMFFETEVDPPSGCPEGWAIGRVSSLDGLSWTRDQFVAGPSAVAPCGVRSPSVVLHDDGTFALFFQILDPARDDGVGVNTNVSGAVTTTVLEDLRGVYEPTAARVDGVWSVMGVDPDQGLVVARSSDLATFVFDPAPEIPTGATPWSSDGVLMPALGCVDDTAFPWELYFGGWSGTETGWAWAVGAASGAWYVTASLDLWTDDSAWRSLDFVTDGVSTTVFFETLDADGHPRIGVSTRGEVLTTDLRDRDCVQ